MVLLCFSFSVSRPQQLPLHGSPHRDGQKDRSRWDPTLAPGCCHTAVVHEWVKQLADHPDRAFRDYIFSSISHRFRIGFNYDKCSCRPAKANMPSAIENPSVVQAHLDVEVALGRVCGPVQSQLTNQVVEADTRLFKPG